jgi:hypothetical protein
MNASYRLPIPRRIWLLAALLLTITSTLFAKPPEPPTLGVTVSNGIIRLEWKPGQQGDPATAYRIYQAKPVDPNGSMGEFALIGTTEKTTYEITGPAPGIYFVFYVTAYNADGESAQSNLAKAGIDGGTDPTSAIKFVTEPIHEVTLGAAYRYDAEAVAVDGEPVRYKVGQAPLGAPIPYAEGMTVDRATGLVEWTPKAEGTFAAAIIAYLASDSTVNAMQVAIITVKAPACAMIRGTVRDSSGLAIDNGWITAVSGDGSSGTNWNVSISTEVVAGEYSLPVSDGTYILYLKHPQIGAVWYRNARDVSGAERVTVTCGDTVRADFSVTLPPEPVHYTVTGRVTAKSDGRGVPAIVQFMTRDKGGKTLTSGNGVIYPDGIVTKTDMDGRYSVDLSDEFGYIAEAIPEGDELLPQYYNGVTSPTEATLVTAASAKGPVDFSLSPRPVYDNSIGGSVKDETGGAVASQVIAIRIPDGSSSDPATNEFARSTAAGDDGTFTLKNLVPGDYLLLAIPQSRDYVPGYFLSGAPAALNWKDGTRITIGETTIAMGNGIVLRRRDGLKGFAKLSGYVKIAPGATRSRDVTLGYDLLPGVFLYALDPDGHVSDYTFSDPSGWFELNELGATDYRIIADKVGYASQVITTTLDYKDRSAVVEDLTMSRGSSSVDLPGVTDGAFTIYPNPAGSRLLMQFDAVAGTGSFTITDALGRTVSTAPIDAVDGMNSVAIDVSSLSAGSYRLRLRTGTMNASVPLTIVR